MIRYQRNNIIFRIASASAIGKFKEAQAHSFLQLARKDLNFDEAAREVVLLEFDRFSQWIFRIERICVAVQESLMPQQLRQAIIESFIEELRVIEGVIETHPKVFPREILTFMKVVHQYSSVMMAERFNLNTMTTVDSAFTTIVEAISVYLQHILITLHEFDNNVVKRSTRPFVCISGFSIDTVNEHDKYLPCISRVKYFISENVGNQYTFKNYTDQQLFDDTQAHLAPLGVELIPEEVDLSSQS